MSAHRAEADIKHLPMAHRHCVPIRINLTRYDELQICSYDAVARSPQELTPSGDPDELMRRPSYLRRSRRPSRIHRDLDAIKPDSRALIAGAGTYRLDQRQRR